MLRRNTLLLSLAAVGIILFSFLFGYTAGLMSSPSGEAFASMEQAWNTIISKYVENQRIDENQLKEAAIEGMLQLLDDPHSAYLSREEYQSTFNELEGKYEGIGAEVTERDGQIIVVAPFAGSPAEEAGILPGDIVLEIDGTDITGLDLYQVILKVRGDGGTAVNLLVIHQGETEPVEIEIIRGEINTPSVYFEMMGDIAYIYLSFTDQTNKELTPVLEAIAAEGATGIIIDLRNNPGGPVGVVTDVASRFLQEETVIFTIRDNEGNTEVIKASKQPETTDLPLAVLVNSFSASGSEVLAGAFQDYQRAIIAGSTTFGKGSVNYLIQLEDGSGLYITYARWLTPDGRLIEGEGITPDIELKLEGDEAIQWAIDYLHINN
ncbi:S41 family peptidase [Chloroflexota bacterium]